MDIVPQSILNLRTEANLEVIWPLFEKSLDIPGDIAEFGCYRGTMSIKFAWCVKALHYGKAVYAFDTFKGFAPEYRNHIGGSYDDAPEAEEDLQKWAYVLPLVVVKGDARKTACRLCAPLSFVWLDLDVDELLGPVLAELERARVLTSETIIGLDDYGRPETPTVKPWADAVERDRRWEKLIEYDRAFIAFYRFLG